MSSMLTVLHTVVSRLFERAPAVLRNLGWDDPNALTSHLFLMGGSGSGKSSIIKLLMEAALTYHENTSCCWFCVKADEAERAIEVIESSPKYDRLMHLVPGKFTFNVAAYELTRKGGSPASLTRLLDRLSEMLSRAKGGGEDQAFWAGLFRRGMEAAITICWFAERDRITLQQIYDCLQGCPSSIAEVQSDGFRQKKFYHRLQRAQAGLNSPAEEREYMGSAAFFLNNVTTIGDKARGAMLTQCANVLAPLLQSPFYETLCAEKSSFTPEMPLTGECVVIDFPVLTYGPPALLLQNLISMTVMEAALRRPNPDFITMFVKDEFQLLCADPEFETMGMSVARSHGICSVSATQNLPLLRVAMGGDAQGEQLALGLLGNFNTRLVLANQCTETNDFFSRSWGQNRQPFVTASESKHEEDLDLMTLLFGPDRFLLSVGEQLAPRCPPEALINLRRGGPTHNYWIDAFLTQGGKTFGPDNSPFRLVSFRQV